MLDRTTQANSIPEKCRPGGPKAGIQYALVGADYFIVRNSWDAGREDGGFAHALNGYV